MITPRGLVSIAAALCCGLYGCTDGSRSEWAVQPPEEHRNHQPKEGQMPHQMNSREMQECTRLCQECADICRQTSAHCLRLGGSHAEVEHQGILQDCADICDTSARFMGRGSHHHAHVCRECAEICNACAESCERVDKSDAMMKRCAEVCRRCAQSCEKMAAAGVGGR